MNLAAQIIKRAAQKNNEVAAQNYEFSCPNLRQSLFTTMLFIDCVFIRIIF